MKVSIVLTIAAVLTTPRIYAQQPQPAPASMQPPVVPVEVQPDRRITFRLAAPTASDVQVSFPEPSSTPNKHPMSKGPDGVWTTTIGPVEPEIYQYSLLMGGASINTDRVEVPGTPPRPYEVQNVPHGSFTVHTYFSTVQNRWRGLYVYVPPEYYTEGNRRFPVLYLFAGMEEDDWTRIGRVHVVFDNLIAQKQAVPTIIVMPNNTVGPVAVPALENAAIMEKEMLTEIMPFVEKTYRTLNDREHRAIAGLSFGGGTAFTLGMRHLDKFAYVAEFGSGAFGGGPRDFRPGYGAYNPDQIAPGMYQKLVAPTTRPRLFYMSVGTEDPRAPSQKAAFAEFQKHGFEPVFKTFPGDHEWKVFRNSLIDLALRLFK